jgi:hypothetical protein
MVRYDTAVEEDVELVRTQLSSPVVIDAHVLSRVSSEAAEVYLSLLESAECPRGFEPSHGMTHLGDYMGHFVLAGSYVIVGHM